MILNKFVYDILSLFLFSLGLALIGTIISSIKTQTKQYLDQYLSLWCASGKIYKSQYKTFSQYLPKDHYLYCKKEGTIKLYIAKGSNTFLSKKCDLLKIEIIKDKSRSEVTCDSEINISKYFQ